MSVETQMKLASSRTGRISLHVLALLADHKLEWHWKGVARELWVLGARA